MKTITILLSYPSDQEPSAKIARNTIKEASQLFVHQDVSIRFLDWKTNITTGAASRPQEVINTQTTSVDGIIALLGARLGSSTGEFNSGVEEELEKARKRFGITTGRIHVLFKNNAENISSIDPAELTRIADFKKKLASEGVLFGEFRTPDRFKTLVRQAISKIVLETGLIGPTPSPPTLATNGDALQNFRESRQKLIDNQFFRENPSLLSIFSVIDTFTEMTVSINEKSVSDFANSDPAVGAQLMQAADQKVSLAVLNIKADLDTIYSAMLRQAAKMTPTDGIATKTGVFFLMAMLELAGGVFGMASETFREKSKAIAALSSSDRGFIFARDRLVRAVEEVAVTIDSTGAEIASVLQQIGWRVELPESIPMVPGGIVALLHMVAEAAQADDLIAETVEGVKERE